MFYVETLESKTILFPAVNNVGNDKSSASVSRAFENDVIKKLSVVMVLCVVFVS